MVFKSIEIYYDIDAIPGLSTTTTPAGMPRWDEAERALAFRNDAIDLIEEALVAAEWEGAEIGHGEVNFGFAVEDFDAAEAVVRKAVAGTPYSGFREIVRNEVDGVQLVH